jgi:hypothetical protein
MSVDGGNVLALVKQMRKFCAEIHLLLRSIDDKMAESEWNSYGPAVSDSSTSFASPERWIPICVFRFYAHKDYPKKYPGRLAFVSVLIDDHWDRKYSIKEPLLTAGYYDFGNAEVGENYDYTYSRCFGYLSKNQVVSTNGAVFDFNPKMLPSEVVGKPDTLFEKGQIFGVSLVSIKTSEDAVKFTEKLTALINK